MRASHAKKQLLIQASIHGREYTNSLLAMTGKMGVWNGSFFYFHIYLKKYQSSLDFFPTNAIIDDMEA